MVANCDLIEAHSSLVRFGYPKPIVVADAGLLSKEKCR